MLRCNVEEVTIDLLQVKRAKLPSPAGGRGESMQRIDLAFRDLLKFCTAQNATLTQPYPTPPPDPADTSPNPARGTSYHYKTAAPHSRHHQSTAHAPDCPGNAH